MALFLISFPVTASVDRCEVLRAVCNSPCSKFKRWFSSSSCPDLNKKQQQKATKLMWNTAESRLFKSLLFFPPLLTGVFCQNVFGWPSVSPVDRWIIHAICVICAFAYLWRECMECCLMALRRSGQMKTCWTQRERESNIIIKLDFLHVVTEIRVLQMGHFWFVQHQTDQIPTGRSLVIIITIFIRYNSENYTCTHRAVISETSENKSDV